MIESRVLSPLRVPSPDALPQPPSPLFTHQLSFAFGTCPPPPKNRPPAAIPARPPLIAPNPHVSRNLGSNPFVSSGYPLLSHPKPLIPLIRGEGGYITFASSARLSGPSRTPPAPH